jgi:hypothetical protein
LRSAQSIFEDLGLCVRGAEIDVESLPFSASDITAGSESELQAVVVGDRNSVDLPLQIERSNYFANVSRHIAAGDTPRRVGASIERYLNGNRKQVWSASCQNANILSNSKQRMTIEPIFILHLSASGKSYKNSAYHSVCCRFSD